VRIHFVLLNLLIFILVAGAVGLSKHGVVDLLRLRRQMDAAKTQIATIEEENRRLKTQADLLETPTPALVEQELRLYLGWVKPGELVYFESSDRN